MEVIVLKKDHVHKSYCSNNNHVYESYCLKNDHALKHYWSNSQHCFIKLLFQSKCGRQNTVK